MRIRGIEVLCIAFVMLSSRPGEGQSARPTSAPPVWWEVTESPTMRGLAVACTPTELVFVDTQRRVRVRPATMKTTTTKTGTASWEWIVALGPPEIRCTLAPEASRSPHTWRLSCSDGNRAEEFSLRQASAKRSEELRVLLAASRPAKVVCARAEACCPVAFALLGAKCDLDSELGNPRAPDHCDGFMKGIGMILAEKKVKVPVACRP